MEALLLMRDFTKYTSLLESFPLMNIRAPAQATLRLDRKKPTRVVDQNRVDRLVRYTEIA